MTKLKDLDWGGWAFLLMVLFLMVSLGVLTIGKMFGYFGGFW